MAWIKGHAGHAGNEMADQLANKGVDGFGDETLPNPIVHNDEKFYDKYTQTKTPLYALQHTSKTLIMMVIPVVPILILANLPKPDNRDAPEKTADHGY